jgi:hypothetical protein
MYCPNLNDSLNPAHHNVEENDNGKHCFFLTGKEGTLEI